MGLLSAEVAGLLPFFDGSHTIRDLQAAMMRARGNQLVMLSEVERLIRELDELFVLQTPRYHEGKQALKSQFASLDRRPAFLSGSAYPSDREALDTLLEGIVSRASSALPSVVGAIRAVVAPHIDLSVGQAVYGNAYAAVRGLKPNRILILGTGHGLDEGIFSVTTKDYETPLGSFPTDTHAANALREAGGALVAPDDFAHRSEHSIEFQVLFLRHLLPESIPIVPVLFGTFEELQKIGKPSDIPEVGRFLDVLRSLIDERTLIVAGVDLSHVGPKFGHDRSGRSYEPEFRAHDEQLLAALCRGSVTDFWAEGQRVNDQYNVCGFPVLACLLEILPESRGTILGYEVWHEEATKSAVSFAAVGLGSREWVDGGMG